MMCIWPGCDRPSIDDKYCRSHYGLLVYRDIIEDKELDKLWQRVIQKARAEVASRYPDNPDYRKWDDGD